MNPLTDLKWHRLSATLLNVRAIQAMRSHPFSVMEAIIKGTTLLIEDKTDPQVFFHIKDKNHTFSIRKSVQIPLEIFFVGKTPPYVEQWRNALAKYLSDPVNGKNFEILKLGDVEERSYEMLASEIQLVDDEGELCLEFLSPFPFTPRKPKSRTDLSEESFVRAYEKRFSRLFGKPIDTKAITMISGCSRTTGTTLRNCTIHSLSPVRRSISMGVSASSTSRVSSEICFRLLSWAANSTSAAKSRTPRATTSCTPSRPDSSRADSRTKQLW